MKKTVMLLLLVIICATQSVFYNAEARSSRTSSSDVYVEGYTRKDGTYVAPYYRTPPDSSLTNNYSCIDDGRCGGGTADYTSTYTYTPPTNLCGVNSYAVGSECRCYYGYEWVDKNDPSNRDCKLKVIKIEPVKNVFQDYRCNTKFPGTVYRSSDDSCTCPGDVGGSSWNPKNKSCSQDVPVVDYSGLNAKCNQKYPGTVYQSSGDKCVCTNGSEYDPVKKSCEKPETVKCNYSDGTKAEVGDRSLENKVCQSNGIWSCEVGYALKDNICVSTKIKCDYADGTKANIGDRSAEYKICQTDGTWACEKGNVWNTEVNKCLSEGDNSCKASFGNNSIWNFEYSAKGEFMCSCITGYILTNNKCVLPSNKTSGGGGGGGGSSSR